VRKALVRSGRALRVPSLPLRILTIFQLQLIQFTLLRILFRWYAAGLPRSQSRGGRHQQRGDRDRPLHILSTISEPPAAYASGSVATPCCPRPHLSRPPPRSSWAYRLFGVLSVDLRYTPLAAGLQHRILAHVAFFDRLRRCRISGGGSAYNSTAPSNKPPWTWARPDGRLRLVTLRRCSGIPPPPLCLALAFPSTII